MVKLKLILLLHQKMIWLLIFFLKKYLMKKIPKIKFVATKIEQDRIFGDLTIRNVTKNVEFDLENSGEFFGKIYLKISGKIKRSYFDLTWDELLDTGSSSVDNDIFIEIDIEAKKKKNLILLKLSKNLKNSLDNTTN